MIIPFEHIAPDTLINLIEEFITREGTDYGEVELSLEQKVDTLKAAIRVNDVLIVFDEASESVNLVTAHDYNAEENKDAGQC